MGSSKKAPTRSRIKYRADQIEALEESFLIQQYPDSETIEKMAEKVGVSTERVTIWFQNRRAKFKRESKDVQMAMMRRQLYTRPPDTTRCMTSEKSAHAMTLTPPAPHVDGRLQTEYHPPPPPPRSFQYLPNAMTTNPNDVHTSSFASGVSTPSNALMMTSAPPYSNSIPQRQVEPGYTPCNPAFHPQYFPEYQQPYYRHYAPPKPLMPVNHLHVSYTPGYQLMQL